MAAHAAISLMVRVPLARSTPITRHRLTLIGRRRSRARSRWFRLLVMR
jgi:hypothetical protein